MKKATISACGFVAWFTTAASAQAAGFALIEQSASGMGNAYAGGSAVAEDASTIFFNPAGMTYIDGTQAAGALHLINPNAEFHDDGSIAAQGVPGHLEAMRALMQGDLAFVPNFYVMTDITPSVRVGLGINAPFGLKTEYDDDGWGAFRQINLRLKRLTSIHLLLSK